MTAEQYRRPPITEAIVNLKLATTADQNNVERVVRKLKGKYGKLDEERSVEFSVDVASSADVKPDIQWSGVKLSSSDQNDITIARRAELVFSRLAPYAGFEQLFERAKEEWRVWTKEIGRAPLLQIGLRYINRLDIPESKIRIEDYLNVGPKLPKVSDAPISLFKFQVNQPLGVDDCILLLNAGTVKSPLPDHSSLVLDIDIVRRQNIPIKDDKLWEAFELMRTHKNRVFEASITDKSRQLFG